jgi:hypothetical protein
VARWDELRPDIQTFECVGCRVALVNPAGILATARSEAWNCCTAPLSVARTPGPVLGGPQGARWTDRWLGTSERNIKRIFRDARRCRERTVLLFDEFDSVISYAGEGGDAASQAVNAVAGIFEQ